MKAYNEQHSKAAPFKVNKEQIELPFLDCFALFIRPQVLVLIDLFGQLIGVIWTVTVALLTSDLSAPCGYILYTAYYFQASFLELKHIIETHNMCDLPAQSPFLLRNYIISALLLEVKTSVIRPPLHNWPVWSCDLDFHQYSLLFCKVHELLS